MATFDSGATEHGTPAGKDPSAGDRQLLDIDEEECFALLSCQDLGRLAIVRDGRPEIFPVNYALDGRTITIRTSLGVKLDYASLAYVAFEVEDIDPISREGWVVVVHGLAQDITDAIDRWSVHALATEVRPWVSGPHEHHLAIGRSTVSGRRLRRRR